jgi:hypothetical protein
LRRRITIEEQEELIRCLEARSDALPEGENKRSLEQSIDVLKLGLERMRTGNVKIYQGIPRKKQVGE